MGFFSVDPSLGINQFFLGAPLKICTKPIRNLEKISKTSFLSINLSEHELVLSQRKNMLRVHVHVGSRPKASNYMYYFCSILWDL